ncbi:uncharacterized protein MELLADRAFT_109342 [Melampsora larici-populina 98AG31]|uniref:Uncharacterized protein n=1 Tax=Melampsora larici-populina (strain 98AG31 / pathotype 3-4-7) TaxID=747676 RepID=F4RW56_MELLP|nr:uncharacterized protein MELLADRAFT_109342 [Melampsora larici-populina 98AG31]EGG03222.1 hypothetical protein MELLADRAFT_109342 [Melampsora larici-populina 98AG31]
MSSLSPKSKALIEKLYQSQYPEVYPYVPKVIITYMVVYFFVLILSLLLIIIPCLRGQEARRKHLWLWRKQYANGSKYLIPYYIPNGGIAFVISQIFGSILFEIYLFLAFYSIKFPEFSKNSYQYFCIFSPSRTTTTDGTNKIQKYLIHPIIMNTICIITPIIPTLISIGWGIASIVTRKAQFQAYQSVIHQIKSDINPTIGILKYTKAGFKFLDQFRWACLFWSFAAILSMVFYSFAILLFLRLLKTTVEVNEGKKGLEGFEVSKTLAPSRFSKKLRKSYYLLMWQCILLMVVSTWYLVDAIILMIRIDDVVTSQAWRSLFDWLVVSSSFLLAGALVLQSWRMLIDKDEPQIVIQREIKISTNSHHPGPSDSNHRFHKV